MDNKDKKRVIIVFAALAVLLFVGTFWLLSRPDDPATVPEVAQDSSPERAKLAPRQGDAPVAPHRNGSAGRQPPVEAPKEVPKRDAKEEGAGKPAPSEPAPGEEKTEPAEKPKEEPPSKPDPDAPISVDFVNRDIQTVMHYIALKGGLDIVLEGSLDTKITIMMPNRKPRDIIKTICDANNLEMTESGTTFLVKKSDREPGAYVVRGSRDGLWTVNVINFSCLATITEFARVTGVQVMVPADTVTRERDTRISLYLLNATPEDALLKIAELGGLKAEKSEDATPVWTFRRK